MDPKNTTKTPPPAATKPPTPVNTMDPMKRLSELEEIVLDGEQTIKDVDIAVKEVAKENQAMRNRLRAILETEEVKRPWSWKRIVWATVSGGGGLALSFFLRKKQPMLNHAASASLGMMAFDRIKPLKGFKPLGGAVAGLGSRWAHDNFEALEIGMAGAAYGYAAFQIGEASIDGFKDGWKQSVERVKAIKERIRQSRADAAAQETEDKTEDEAHASE